MLALILLVFASANVKSILVFDKIAHGEKWQVILLVKEEKSLWGRYFIEDDTKEYKLKNGKINGVSVSNTPQNLYKTKYHYFNYLLQDCGCKDKFPYEKADKSEKNAQSFFANVFGYENSLKNAQIFVKLADSAKSHIVPDSGVFIISTEDPPKSLYLLYALRLSNSVEKKKNSFLVKDTAALIRFLKAGKSDPTCDTLFKLLEKAQREKEYRNVDTLALEIINKLRREKVNLQVDTAVCMAYILAYIAVDKNIPEREKYIKTFLNKWGVTSAISGYIFKSKKGIEERDTFINKLIKNWHSPLSSIGGHDEKPINPPPRTPKVDTTKSKKGGSKKWEIFSVVILLLILILFLICCYLLNNQIDRIKEEIENKKKSEKEMGEKLDEMSGKVNEVNQKIEEKPKEIEKQIKDLKKDIETLNNNVEEINSSQKQFKQQLLKELNTQISGIKEEIKKEQNKKFEEIQNDIKSLDNKLDNIPKTLLEELRKVSQPVEEVKESSDQAPSKTEFEEEKPGQEEKLPSEPDIEPPTPEGTKYEVYKNILDKSKLINKLEEAGIELPDKLKELGEYYRIVSKYPSKKEGEGIYIWINDIDDSGKFTDLEGKLLNLGDENFVRLLNDESVKRRPELRNEIRKFLESQGYRVIGEELRGKYIMIRELKKWAEIENKDEIGDLLSAETPRIDEVKDWGVIDSEGRVRKSAVVRVSR